MFEGTNGNLRRCHSSLQIKRSCFRETAEQFVVQEGGIRIWWVFAVFIVIFLSPAVLHWLCVCVRVSRSNCVTSIRFCTLWSLCTYTACTCFYQRDNCVRWCWEYEKIGNDRFSPFFTAVVEFPNYVITLSLLRPSRSDATADSASLYYSGSQTRRERFFFLSLKIYIKRCQPHPGGQRSVPREAECGCCLRSRHPPEWRLCDGSQFLSSCPWQLWHR